MHLVEAVWARSNTFCACLEGALFVVVSTHVDKQSRGRKHVMIAENRAAAVTKHEYYPAKFKALPSKSYFCKENRV